MLFSCNCSCGEGITFILSPLLTAKIVISYLALKSNSINVLPTHLFGVTISIIEYSGSNSIWSSILSDTKLWATLIPISLSGNTTLSAPILYKTFAWSSSLALQTTCSTPISFAISVAIIDALISEPIAIIATSKFPSPKDLSAYSSVTSTAATWVTLSDKFWINSSLLSIAITWWPNKLIVVARDEPNLPHPITIYCFINFILSKYITIIQLLFYLLGILFLVLFLNF